MKKGISPLVAGVLLIALTVGIAAVITNFMTGFTREQVSGIQNKYKVKCNYVSASFDGDPDTSASEISFNIYNNGQEVLNSTKQYAIWSDGTTSTLNATINLDIDEYKKVTISNDTDCQSGCSGWGSKTLSRLRISVDACKGSAIEWKSE